MEDVTEKVNKQLTEIFLDTYDNKVKDSINSVNINIFNN